MFDWVTASSLATAAGTLVLAVATFSSVRSANRTARSAERALQVGLRPVLFASRPDDPSQQIRWGDDHWASIAGGQAVLEPVAGTLYMAMSLRNVGSGLAVLRGWRVEVSAPLPMTPGDIEQRRVGLVRPDPDSFRLQGRDLYVPPGDISFWQAAYRDPEDPERSAVIEAVEAGQGITINLLYGDHEGGQRTISQFSATHTPGDNSDWVCAVVRHWNLDRNDPR